MTRLGEIDVGAEEVADGEEDDEEVARGAVTAIGTDARGEAVTLSPLPVTVSRTDLTEAAVAAIGTCACICLGAAPLSTVPMSHAVVPFFLLQP